MHCGSSKKTYDPSLFSVNVKIRFCGGNGKLETSMKPRQYKLSYLQTVCLYLTNMLFISCVISRALLSNKWSKLSRRPTRQVALMYTHIQSAPAPYWFCPLLSCFEYIDAGHFLGRPIFVLKIAPLRVRIWTPSNTVMSCMRVCRKQALSRVKYYYYVINGKIQQQQ